MNEKIDRRILKSQKLIQSIFLEMLLKKGFDEITVKEITDVADISRKTFYLHYVDKYDLLDTVINKKLKELDEICEQKKEKGFVEGTIIWFNYFEKYKDFFSALFTSKSTVSFRDQLLEFMMNQLNKKIDKSNYKKDSEILIRFLGMAVLAIVESFVLNELTSTTEEIATEVGELLKQNITFASTQ